jgi:hypothetical protein
MTLTRNAYSILARSAEADLPQRSFDHVSTAPRARSRRYASAPCASREINRQPGVHGTAVVGVPDERSAEAPDAVIVRGDPWPRNPTGKILKRVLRPWIASEVATRGDAMHG